MVLPARTQERKPTLGGSCRALAGRGESFAPGIHELHDVVATFGVGHVQKNRLLRKIEPGGGIESVCIGTDHLAKAIVGEGQLVAKAVEKERIAATGGRAARHLNDHQRIGKVVSLLVDLTAVTPTLIAPPRSSATGPRRTRLLP